MEGADAPTPTGAPRAADAVESADHAGSEAAGSPSSGTDRGRRSRVAPWVAFGVLVVMVGLFVMLATASPENTTADSPLLGRPAPEATGTLGTGEPFDLSRRRGSFVVLNFFRADCVPCIEEHPELVRFVELQDQLGADGAEFYSVVVDDTQADVEEFFERFGGDWPVVYSDADRFSVAFGVAAVPETWIVDDAGFVRARFVGPVTADSLSVRVQQIRETPAS